MILVPFFQNKFYNEVFIFAFSLFHEPSKTNVTNVTVTYVTNFSVESFWNYWIETIERFG